MSKIIKYNSRPLDSMKVVQADQFFSKKEKSGLYFSTEYYSNRPSLSELQVNYDQLFLHGQNQYVWKQVERWKGEEILRFDSFEPLDNQNYFIFSRDEVGECFIHHMEEAWPHTYDNVAQLAAHLSANQQVIIAEQQVRAFRVDERCAAAHPFAPEDTGLKRYFFRRSYGSFSKLGPLEMNIESYEEVEKMARYFSMGYANLGFYVRLSLFSRGEWFRFKKASNNEEVLVLDRDRFVESFPGFNKAKAFVEREQRRSTHGVEYLVAKLVQSHSWH